MTEFEITTLVMGVTSLAFAIWVMAKFIIHSRYNRKEIYLFIHHLLPEKYFLDLLKIVSTNIIPLK